MDRCPLEVSLLTLRKKALRHLRRYPPTEAQAIIRRLLDHFWPDWSLAWLETKGQAFFPPEKLPSWELALNRLANGEPLPYVTGETFFGELRLAIRPGVFCPRPETEEWAYFLKNLLRHKPPNTILDIGTGSGCLALFLGRAFPKAKVYALDISPLAIELASQNAALHVLQPALALWDFFSQGRLPPEWDPISWDLIVSNPPYIPLSEKDSVDENVLQWEPKEALFCLDIEPYIHLANLAATKLDPQRGLLAVELYPPTAERVLAHFEKTTLHIRMYRDLANRWRWLIATKNPLILQGA